MATIKKAQKGKTLTPSYSNIKGKGWDYFKTPTAKDSSDYKKGFDKKIKGENIKQYPSPTGAEIRGYNEASKRTKKSTPKAQDGKKVIKGSRPGIGVFRTEKERTTVGGVAKPYKYTRTSIDTTGYSKGKPTYNLKTETGEGDKFSGGKAKSNSSKKILRKDVPSALKSLKLKSGGSIKAKDGKWIQKAVNPKHKGYCTPLSKKTCTPKRKALALTFKKMAKERKAK